MNLEHAKKQLSDNQKITGHLAYLDDKRLVFIGKHPDYLSGWMVAFQNEKGEQTRLRLSQEAMAMLVQLYNKKTPGGDTFPLKIDTYWHVVEK